MPISGDLAVALFAGDFTWQGDAACLEHLGHDWFADDPAEVEACQDICDRCLVRGDCLEFAVANSIEFGIWGGCTEAQRSGRPACSTCGVRPARATSECAPCQGRRR